MTDISRIIAELGTSRDAARAHLVAMGEVAFLPLLNAIDLDDTREVFMTDVMAVFLSAGTRGIDFLQNQLQQGEWPLRNYADQVLGRVSLIAEADVPLLKSLAASPDSDVSETATHLLRQLRFRQQRQREDDMIVQVLCGASGATDEVRAILVEREPPQSMQVLWPFLRSQDLSTRRRTAEMLRALSEESYSSLALWLDDERMAAAAATAIGELGQPNDVFTLIDALQKRPSEAAILALGRIGNGMAVRPLLFFLADRNSYGYYPTIQALVAIGGPAVEPLIEALKDDNHDMRMGAVLALGEIGDARAVKPLMAMWRDP